MKNYFIIAVLMLFTSCGLLRSKEVVRTEVFRDSVTIRNEVFIDTFKIAQDTFGAQLPFEYLKQIGELTFRGDRTTTKIYYRDGNIGFTTESDSLIHLLLNKVSSLEKSKYQDKTIVSTEVKKKPNRFFRGLIWSLVLSLLLAIAVYLIILKIKR